VEFLAFFRFCRECNKLMSARAFARVTEERSRLRFFSQARNFRLAIGSEELEGTVDSSEKRPIDQNHASREEREVARKRDELLSEARRSVEGQKGEGSGSALMGLGLQFVIVILVCLYAGMWLDRKLGTAPWLLVLGVVVGASAGFYSMYHVMMDENRKASGVRRADGDKKS
jgi:F0F1-type ATP synthase assembly protein I